MDIDLQPQVKLKQSFSVWLGWAFLAFFNKQQKICKFFVVTVKIKYAIYT